LGWFGTPCESVGICGTFLAITRLLKTALASETTK